MNNNTNWNTWIISSVWFFICGLIGYYFIFPELGIWSYIAGAGAGFVLTLIGILLWFELIDKKRSEKQQNEHKEMLDRHFKTLKHRNEIATLNWEIMTHQEHQQWRLETQRIQDVQKIEYKALLNKMFP